MQTIRDLRQQGITRSEITRILKVNRTTVSSFMKEHLGTEGENYG